MTRRCRVSANILTLKYHAAFSLMALDRAEAPPQQNTFKVVRFSSLTRRQTEVLDLIMQGKSNKAIGRALNLSETTVKHHVTGV